MRTVSHGRGTLVILTLSIWAHQLGKCRPFLAPKLTNLYVYLYTVPHTQHVNLRLHRYLTHKKTPNPLRSHSDPGHRPMVGSWGGAFSYVQGTPVMGHPGCGGARSAPRHGQHRRAGRPGREKQRRCAIVTAERNDGDHVSPLSSLVGL